MFEKTPAIMPLPSALSHNNIKRDDLQCWRALSIAAVLLFHIWPKQFPNGYLGVDIFFVLSGYLMAGLYCFEKQNLMASTMDFYYRRVKRILPIYLVVILVTLVLLSSQIFPDEYKLIVEDSKWAIGLATNYQDVLKNNEYFDMKASFRFFRHCWSLAVEMQFYLLFPVIAIARSHISPTKYRLLLVSLLCGSLLHQITSTSSIIQYESVFCRVWQFAFGMLALTLPEFPIKWLPSALLLSTCAILFCAISLPRLAVSFVTIAMASSIISMSTHHFHPYKTLLQSQNAVDYLVTLGDISYVVYLIHWPLITYSRFISSQTSFTYFDGFLLFMTSIMLSKLAHFIIEKPLIKFCNGYRNLLICLIVLYASSMYIPEHLTTVPIQNQGPSELTLDVWKQALNFDSPMILPPEWTTSNDIEFATKLRGDYMGGAYVCNKKNVSQERKLPKLYYCEVMGNPNGTLVGLSIGNSFSMNIVSAVSSNPLFKKVINVYASGAHFPIHDKYETYLIEKLIKPMKPDVVFLVQRYYEKYLFKTPIDQIKSHKEFKYWNDVLQIIQNYTSAIIINKEQITFPYDISQDFIRRKSKNLPIDTKLENPRPSASLEAWLTSLNCSKCQLFGYRDAFCDGDFCQIMDLATGLPLFRDDEHISPIGVRHLKPFITKAINKALNISRIDY